MQLIDWYNLFANALWIFALALALAVIGFARWDAAQVGERVGAVLNHAAYQHALNAAGALFSLGLAATADRVWEWALWLAMTALFALQSGVLLWQARKSGSP